MTTELMKKRARKMGSNSKKKRLGMIDLLITERRRETGPQLVRFQRFFRPLEVHKMEIENYLSNPLGLCNERVIGKARGRRQKSRLRAPTIVNFHICHV